MPEFYLELFSEEIPARMQAKAADDLARLLAEALAGLQPRHFKTFYGPRRIACAAELRADIPASRSIERGPRSNAPPQAMAGFLRKHAADLSDVREEAGFFVLDRASPAVSAATLIAETLPALLRRFPWPKSMRWGGTSAFTWVRPLRRIICLFDGAIVPFSLRDGDDDGHGLVASNLTEGHRFLAPGEFAVASCAEWQAGLLARKVVVDAAERRAAIAAGIAKVAAEAGYSVVEDAGLLDEVAGLVEWPVPLLGRIGADYMDLPAEVMQVSMRVNQRYFALRTADGKAAPAFAFVANIAATDGGAAIIAGNERVLSARFSDARHFWDLDRRNRLDTRVAALDAITFHAKLGSQGYRVRRIEALAGQIARWIEADPWLAMRAAKLAKADLTSGMVGEFPELQGVMGGYYAAYDGEEPKVVAAVRDHYLPRGPNDRVPTGDIAVSVAVADKIDQIISFRNVGIAPSGSGDPFAIRRAALGVIRIILEGNYRISLVNIARRFCAETLANVGDSQISSSDLLLNSETGDYDFGPRDSTDDDQFEPRSDVLAGVFWRFILNRWRVMVRAEGIDPRLPSAVTGAIPCPAFRDGDLCLLREHLNAVAAFLATEDGANLLAAYRRAANILRIEENKDGPHNGAVDPALLQAPEEQALAATLFIVELTVITTLGNEDFTAAMAEMARLRPPVDAFFEAIQVNADDLALRKNRLRLLARLRGVMNQIADFSRIDG